MAFGMKSIWMGGAAVCVLGGALAWLAIGVSNRGNLSGKDIRLCIGKDTFSVDGECVVEAKIRQAALIRKQQGGSSRLHVVLDEDVRFDRVRKTLLPFLEIVPEDLLISTTADPIDVLVTPLVCPTIFVDAHLFHLLITKDNVCALTNSVVARPITLEEISGERDPAKPLQMNFTVRDDVSGKRFHEAIGRLASLTNSFLVWVPDLGAE